jgi:hypothetical protein
VIEVEEVRRLFAHISCYAAGSACCRDTIIVCGVLPKGGEMYCPMPISLRCYRFGCLWVAARRDSPWSRATSRFVGWRVATVLVQRFCQQCVSAGIQLGYDLPLHGFHWVTVLRRL